MATKREAAIRAELKELGTCFVFEWLPCRRSHDENVVCCRVRACMHACVHACVCACVLSRANGMGLEE